MELLHFIGILALWCFAAVGALDVGCLIAHKVYLWREVRRNRREHNL